MDRQLSFQERREALAARRGRFVDMHEDDDTTAAGLVSSSSTNPTAAVPPRAHSVPPTIVRATSSSANPVNQLPQKAKAIPGPKTYENDAIISLRLNIAEQLCHSGVHLITNAPLRKQGKVNMYYNNVLSPDGCMHGLSPYNCEDPYKKFWALLMRGVKYDAQQFEPDDAAGDDDHRTPLQTLQALSHGILEGMNTAEAAAKEKTAEAKRKAAEIKSANQASEVELGLRTPMKRLSSPLLGVQPSARRSHAHASVDVDLTSSPLSTREIYFPCFSFSCSSALTFLSHNFAGDSNIVRSEHEREEARSATAGVVGDIKYGKGEKKKAKRDFDYVKKMDQMFDCILHQPVDLLSIVKEIQHNAVVPPATTPSVAPDSSPASKYNRKFREINDNIKVLMEQRELAKRFNEVYDHIDKRL